MKLIKPSGVLTQIFGVNPQVYAPLKGHSGEDYMLGFKKPFNASVDGYVYSTQNLFNPDTDKYRAVYQIVDDKDFSYEVSYGHIDTCLVKEGDFVKAGQPIATEGNWGLSFSNGVKVKPEEKASGKGSHLHFQVRKCKRVKKQSRGKTYLRKSEGIFKKDGFIYEVVDFNNGFNGCIDPAQFYEPQYFPIEYRQRSPEVEKIQRKLKELGFFKVEPTGFYGDITAEAVFEFQKKYVNLSWYERNVLRGMKFGEKSIKALSNL